MGHVRTQQAGSDLNEIWYYVATESGSLDIADCLIDSITDRFFLLANYPHIGRPRDEDLRPGLRSFPVGENVILYRIQGEDVLILRVLRAAATLKCCSTIDNQHHQHQEPPGLYLPPNKDLLTRPQKIALLGVLHRLV